MGGINRFESRGELSSRAWRVGSRQQLLRGPILCRFALLLGVLTVALFGAAPAVADVQPFEVQQYRKDLGISEATAQAHLELQQSGRNIVEQLEDGLGEGYAGVWFDSEAGEFVVSIANQTAHGAVGRTLSTAHLDNAHRVRSVAHSWEELEAAQKKIDSDLSEYFELDLVQTSLDPRTNAVVVHVASSANENDRAGLIRIANGVAVRVELRDSRVARFQGARTACAINTQNCSRPLRGGVEIGVHNAPYGDCTAAFRAVGDTNNQRYLITAGHCAAAKNPSDPIIHWDAWDEQEILDWRGEAHYLGSVEQYSYPGHDWMKINVTGSWWDTLPWPAQVAYWQKNSVGPAIDEEYPINGEASSYVGMGVCHSGAQSGGSCGTVKAVNVTYDFGTPYKTYDLIKVAGACSAGGDSGGPWFAMNTAYGIHIGNDSPFGGCETTTYNTYYQEITEATDALGVTIKPIGAPSVTTNPATGVSAGKATLNGDVNPNTNETQYYFQYGTTTGYGSTIPIPSGSVGNGTGTVGVNATLNHLKPNTTYHYRVVATNAAGTRFGSNAQFKTLTAPIPGEDDNFGGGHPVVQSNGTIDVFYRTPSGGLGHNAYVNGAWGQLPLPGSLASSSVPHPVVQSNGTIDVFYRTPSGGLGHNAYVNGVWGQDVLPGSVASDPHPVVQSNGTIDVFYRTPSGGLGHTVYVNGSWSLAPLPGSVVGDPYPIVQSNGTIDVFYRTPTGGLGHNAYVNGAWGQPPLPGSLASSSVPHPVVQSNGTIDVFYRTPSGGLGHTVYVNGAWHLAPLPGSLAKDPHPVVQSNGTIDVFYKTPSGGLGHTVHVNGAWSLAPLPGSVAGEPHPVVQSNGTIDVFYRTPTGGLGHNAYVKGVWGQPSLAGSLDPSEGMGVHAVAQSDGTIDVFYRTPSGGLGHNAYMNGVWSQNVLPGEL